MGRAKVGVGIAVPVLNEAPNIGRLLRQIEDELQGVDYTICIVDDGSSDGTADEIESWTARDGRIRLLRRPRASGGCQRGGASRAALEWLAANTDHGVFADVDADGSNRPAELRHGIDMVASMDYDVVIASKYVFGSEVLHRPALRRLASRLYSALLRILIHPCIRDYSNSYRFYSRRAAEAILSFQPLYRSPVYLVEMMARWVATGQRMIEVPTVYDGRDGGSSKVTLWDFALILWGGVRVGLRYRMGAYGSAD